MGFISDVVSDVGSIFSGGSDDAAQQAAQTQSASADRAIDLQRESRDLARKDLQPFKDAGQSQLSPLSSLISDPNAQLNFIQNNPFFKALADDAQSRLFSNQAARGKVGSGGTAQALQNSLLLLGQGLLDNNINQRMGLATMGQNAAAGQGTVAMQSGNAISDLITGQGNALAAGQVGAANARSQGINSLIQGGSAALQFIGLSDRRAKTDITEIGKSYDGLPLYRFRYIGDPELRVGVMAQDVEKVRPDAVMEIEGLKHVNYEALWQ